MELTGEITSIIYQNEVNSYTIAEMYVDEIDGKEDNLITIVGYLPFVVEGDELKIVGRFVEHKEYGRQFKVDTFEKLMPQTLEALERYLGNGMIKGVGPATARKIINTFQEDTINVIKFQPLKLSQIKGITKEKALEISESFIEHWEVWQIVGFLERFGIGAENSKRVYDELGINAIEQIEANPYILIDIARGVDFKQVDKMAMDLGMEQNNDKRVKSAIKYALIRITYNGHCCTLEENLIEYVRSLLGIAIEDIENSYINLKASGEIVEEEREDGEIWVYLANFFDTENSIANKIIDLDNAKNLKYVKNIKKELGKIEIIDDIELSEKQKEAIEAVNDNNVSIITGGPGTGKTTIIKSIIEIYQAKGKKVVLCAPTGRAAKRITETTKREARTIHRLLEITKLDNEDIDMLYNLEVKTIEEEFVIVDEASMLDTIMMNNLIKALNKKTKIIFVGDVDQLPSVGPGNVLKDIISSKIVNTVYLKQIYRQSAKSDIILNAHRVNEGKYPEFKNKDTDMYFIKTNSVEDTLSEISSLVSYRLESFATFDKLKDLQILTPMKKTTLGTIELNNMLQELLNPKSISKEERKVGDRIYRVGDKVMQIQNNYDKRFDVKGEAKQNIEGVYNGDIGYIQKIDNVNKELTVLFDDVREISYDFDELDELELAYATTIHKSQGSEFDYVVLPLYTGYPKLFTRNLLYTAMTRAKKMLVIVGSKKMIEYMVDNVDSKNRMTGLKDKLINKNSKSN